MRSGIEAIHPLTPMQQGMLFHATSEPESALYFHQLLVTVRDADIGSLRRAWETVIDRHPALRSLIAWRDRDRPVRLVRPAVEAEWHVEDLSAHPEAASRIERYVEADRSRPFDLEVPPLLRFALFDLGSGSHRLVWSFHHLILDGWSTRLVLNEVGTLLRSPRSHLERPPPYERYVDWSSDRQIDGEADFWQRHLGDLSGAEGLTGGRSQWTTNHIRRELAFDAGGLAEGAARQGVTLSTLLQGAWALVLGRRSRTRSPVFGVTHAGRPPEVDRIEHLVGMLINTIPRRIEIDERATASEWLSQLHREGLEWSHHHTSSLTDIRKWAGWDRPEPLFDSVVVVENVPDASPPGFHDIQHLERSNVPFALLAVTGPRARLIGIADAAEFDTGLVDMLLEEVIHVAQQLLSESDRAIDAITVLGPTERAALERFEITPSPPLAHATAASLLSEGLDSPADHPAVVAEDGTLDFGGLRSESDRIRSELIAAGASAAGPVAIDAHRRSTTIAAIVACVTGGIPYIPIDPRSAPERRSHMLSAAAVHLDGSGRVHRSAAASPAAPTPPLPDTSAYVMYTSGSTGMPKGVEITQSGLAISTQVRRVVYDEPVGAFLVASPLHFDSSVAGLFWTLADGGTVVLPEDDRLDPIELRRRIGEHAVTHLLTLPSVYEVLLEAGALPSLSTVIVAGEPCPPSLVAKHFDTQPDSALYNEYGPTEATVWATVHRVDRRDAQRSTVPIGRPVPGTRVIVGDIDSGRTPIGAVGEILIAGPQLARGYRADPDRTAVAFDRPAWLGTRAYRTGDLGVWRSDGTLEFHGRRDDQVKLRGHRIELGDIDAQLRRHPAIDDAATVLREGRLVSFVVGAIAPDLEAHLEAWLPPVMRPSIIEVLPEMPTGATGKVDRRALPEVDIPIDTGELRGLDPIEQALANAWSDVLGIEVTDPDADFFALGGDSLAIMKVITRARREGLEITARQFFEAGTLSRLAAVAQAS